MALIRLTLKSTYTVGNIRHNFLVTRMIESTPRLSCLFRHQIYPECVVEYKLFLSQIADDREIPIGIESKKQPSLEQSHQCQRKFIPFLSLCLDTISTTIYILSIADDREILQEFRSEIEPILVVLLLITYQVFGFKRHLVSLHPFPLLTAEKFG